jgi:hypothetical protein
MRRREFEAAMWREAEPQTAGERGKGERRREKANLDLEQKETKGTKRGALWLGPAGRMTSPDTMLDWRSD